ncbi:hypothetical protein AB0F15_43950 [Amycolatopsis sp. NPDC026612]|uniref:hypothetical protein n=1 Tax=Amycolatopsis sp. NPDC026612 TaxID=3155466 RepID=UPI003403886A
MQTALISALTAAVVTLLIEYFAKPSLEGRKDRLVTAGRASRDMLATLESFFYVEFRLALACGDRDWKRAMQLLEVVEKKQESLREKHGLARGSLTAQARAIADEGLRRSERSITTLESGIRAAQQEPGADKAQEFQIRVNTVREQRRENRKAVEMAYVQSMRWTRKYRNSLKRAAKIIRLPPVDGPTMAEMFREHR